MKTLSHFGVIPFDISVLKSQLTSYAKPTNKAEGLVESGELIRLKRGLYVVSPDVSGQMLCPGLIANHIYGPSYVSMETALRHYGLIPESVYTVRSMTTKRSKKFVTPIAEFQYIHCRDEYYAKGIRQEQSNDATYLIATPEKALCDMIVYTPNLRPRFLKNMEEYLQDDLRFDMDRLREFDTELLGQLAQESKKKEEIQNLIKIVVR